MDHQLLCGDQIITWHLGSDSATDQPLTLKQEKRNPRTKYNKLILCKLLICCVAELLWSSCYNNSLPGYIDHLSDIAQILCPPFQILHLSKVLLLWPWLGWECLRVVVSWRGAIQVSRMNEWNHQMILLQLLPFSLLSHSSKDICFLFAYSVLIVIILFLWLFIFDVPTVHWHGIQWSTYLSTDF